MALLNPQALVEARKKKGWTQLQLSEATKPRINVSTISRIERGKPARVRQNTLKELGRALGVGPDSLCQSTEAEREIVKLRIESAARNALTLVALRYRIRRESIIESAPLLFFLAAEQCLQERKKRLETLREAADSLFDMQREMPHLPPHWPIDDGAMSSEEQSIKARDIFGVKVAEAEEAGRFLGTRGDDYDDAEHNPFVVFLRKALAKVIDTTEEIDSVRWTPGLWPSYEICADEASALVGGDEKATRAILCGAAALHEMPKASPADRAEWARAEFDRKYGDLDDLLGELSPSAGGKDGGNIPASSDDGVAS